MDKFVFSFSAISTKMFRMNHEFEINQLQDTSQVQKYITMKL